WLTAATGLRAGGDFAMRQPHAWRECGRQLREQWPEAVRAAGPLGGSAAWHDRLARDAEQAGDPAAARWHLDRVLALGPDGWLPYARSALLHSTAGDYARAEADYAEAAQRGA